MTQISRPQKRTAEALGLVGLVAVIAPGLLIDSRTSFPGWAAAVPVVGSCALILAQGSWVNRLVLSNRVAVSVGLISYPLYLWHWPLLTFAAIRKFDRLTDLENGLIIGATFLLSWLTFKFLEQPVRRSKSFAIPLAASMAAVAVLTQAPLIGYGPQLPVAIAKLVTPPANGIGWRVGECMLLETDKDFATDCADRKRPLITVWGDSTAAALIPGFRNIQRANEFGLAQFTVSSCPPVLLRPNPVRHCLDRNRKIADLIAASAPDIVILHAIWDINDRTEHLRPTVEALRAVRVPRIVILGPVPVWPGGLPDATANYFWRTRTVIPERTRLYFDNSSGDALLQTIAAELGVEYISARDVFCNQDGCLARIGASLSASDTLHLTAAGSQFMVEAVMARLKATPQPTQ